MTYENEDIDLDEASEVRIDFMDIVMLLKSKIAWICAFAMLGTLLAYTYSCFFITPKYRATVIMYVNNKKTSAYVESVGQSDITASAALVPTYQAIVSTKTAMKRAIDEGGLSGYTPEELIGMISTQMVEETGVFAITVTGENQYDVADIANAVALSGTQEISKYIEGTNVSIIDYAVTPETKSSPSNKRNAALGFIAGAFLCVAGIIIIYFMDTRLKKAEDLSVVMDAPVLGLIPSMADSGNEGALPEDKRAGGQR